PAMDAEEIRRTLEAQVTGSVRWSESIEKLLEDGQSHFLEGGPGKVLTGLMGRIRKGTFCMPTGEAEALNDAIVALKAI
ncbi:MAG: ACP S-malonyltransferase, partial [Verrucomicrobiales bacterium]